MKELVVIVRREKSAEVKSFLSSMVHLPLFSPYSPNLFKLADKNLPISKHTRICMFCYNGKVFVCQLEEVWTIRTKKREVHHG